MSFVILWTFGILAAINPLLAANKSLPGMLTDAYGIVTEQDIAEEETRCTDAEGFPPKDALCFQYWQCISLQQLRIRCNDLGDFGGGERGWQTELSIRGDAVTHHYIMRRNYDLAACRDYRAKLKRVLKRESIGCFLGSFLRDEVVKRNGESTVDRYWIIDRVKSRHAMWSYFYRESR